MSTGARMSNERASRLLEAIVFEFRYTLGPRVDVSDLRSFAGEGIADALSRFDGRGILEPFVIQRARWAVLDGLRRLARRSRRPEVRAELLATTATQSAAESATPATPSLEDIATAAAESAPAAPSAPLPTVEMLRDAAASFDLELDAAAAAGTAEEIERDADRMRLRRAIAALPPPMPAVLERYYYLGESFEEVATALGMSRSTAFDVHSRAVRKLRKGLGIGAEPVGDVRAGQ